MNQLLPRFSRMAAPMLARNTNGMSQLSRKTIMATHASTTAMAT